MNVANRIKHLLKARGVPERAIRRELATLCDISQQAVAQWFDESTKNISSTYLAQIAARWSTSMEWLVTGTGTMDSPASGVAADIELDRLIQQLYIRQGEFTAEHFAALDTLVDDLRRRAAARYQQPLQTTDKN